MNRQHCTQIIHAIKKVCQFGLHNALHMQLDNRLVFMNRDTFNTTKRKSGLAFVTFVAVT
jgi:hypothetical protein